jgi:hypothetical protein
MTVPTQPGPLDAAAAETATPSGPGVDLQALAERVLRLLKDELRVERERRGLTPPNPGGRNDRSAR